ncbi:MAG: PorT family protein [Cyclobacteriaceae bacterium]|nr:PorT family protein [Cyclobacteriaceae bacterium]
MKKLLTILVLLHFANISFSQFNVGIKAGATFSNILYDQKPFQQNNVQSQIRPGIMGGLTFQFIHPKNSGIQFEVLYIEKGFNTKYDSINNTQYERSIEYISIPFLMHVSFGKESYQISLILGPYVSYAISSGEVLTDGTQVTSRAYQFDPETDNRFELGLQGGIGIRNEFSFGIIEVQGNISFTFTSLYRWESVNQDPEMDRYFELPEMAQSQVYQVAISYYYPF